MDKLKKWFLVISFTVVITVLGTGSMLLLSGFEGTSVGSTESSDDQIVPSNDESLMQGENSEEGLDHDNDGAEDLSLLQDGFVDLAELVPNIVEQVAPSVVSISAMREVPSFWGNQQLPTSGSGVIYTDDGYIITNNHVIEDAIAIQVTLFDDRTFEATIVGTDPANDLAVLKISAEESIKAAVIGDSTKIRPGEFVIAIGNALSIPGSPTVTVGVVSAVGRFLPVGDGQTGINNLIQTDAVINPGNSGGPLINLSGEIIGINTAILTDAGAGIQAMGIAFAVPSDTAGPIANQLKEFGRVITPLIGIRGRDVNPATAFQEGLTAQRGFLILECTTDGGAEEAGMQPNDIIVALDGTKVNNFGELKKLLRTVYRAGDVVIIRAYRGEQLMEFSVTLQSRK